MVEDKKPVDHWTHDGERIHHLKTVNPYFEEVYYGKKTFEVRKNDRDYQVNDVLHLIEYLPDVVTNRLEREFWCQVTYILHGGDFGIAEGYCIMAIKKIDNEF